ncbi:MAG: hypothetical protein U5N86_07115 [Planctomycetota bacterium]|nr:hypothetical protein [Planctomycetota bacterium]
MSCARVFIAVELEELIRVQSAAGVNHRRYCPALVLEVIFDVVKEVAAELVVVRLVRREYAVDYSRVLCEYLEHPGLWLADNRLCDPAVICFALIDGPAFLEFAVQVIGAVLKCGIVPCAFGHELREGRCLYF